MDVIVFCDNGQDFLLPHQLNYHKAKIAAKMLRESG